jgi:hypothetical protein
MVNQSVLVSDTNPQSEIRIIEYKSKRCGIFGIHWHAVNLDERDVRLTIDHAEELICHQNNYGTHASKARLWLQIDGGPEFEIDDLRVPGHQSYQEAIKERHLCPNHS